MFIEPLLKVFTVFAEDMATVVACDITHFLSEVITLVNGHVSQDYEFLEHVAHVKGQTILF